MFGGRARRQSEDRAASTLRRLGVALSPPGCWVNDEPAMHHTPRDDLADSVIPTPFHTARDDRVPHAGPQSSYA